MENQTNMAKSSATSILYQIFPPPDGVEYTFFSGQTPNQDNFTHICLCDVAGKSFVGKGVGKAAAQSSSATRAIEGLGLALIQKGCGNEVVNIADEKKRLEFMVRDLKTDLHNAETRHESELKLYKETIQNLRGEATILKSDLIKMRDEKELITVENEKLSNYIGTEFNLGKAYTALESLSDAQLKRKVNDAYDKHNSQTEFDILEDRPKIKFSINSKKSQAELKLENERLSDKLTIIEQEKKSLKDEKEKIEMKYYEKYAQDIVANNNLPDQDKVYKLQKSEIKKLKLKNKRLLRSKATSKLKIFNLEVKSKAYDVLESQHLIMKEESEKLQASYAKLEMQHKLSIVQGSFSKPISEDAKNLDTVSIYEDITDDVVEKKEQGFHSELFLLKVENEHILTEYGKTVQEIERNKTRDEEKRKLVKLLMEQVRELEENNVDVVESVKKLNYLD